MIIFDLILTGLTIGAIYGLIALSISLVYSGLDMVHFAQGEFAMMGAFISLMFFTHLGLPYFATLILGAIAIAVMAVLIERIVYRPLSIKGGGMTIAGFSLIAAGVGVSIFLQNLAWVIWRPFPRSFDVDFGDPIQIGNVSYSALYFVNVMAAFVIMIVLHLFLKKTKWGHAIQAVAHNRELASLMGINVSLVLSGTFALAAGVSGLAGGLIGPINFVEWHMGAVLILKAFAAAVIGGLGSLPGAVVGGLLLGVIENVAGGLITSTYRDVVAFALMITILYVRPEGIFRTRVQEKA
jgi:branched-chain amino acid transport system permease protein